MGPMRGTGRNPAERGVLEADGGHFDKEGVMEINASNDATE